MKVTYKSTNKPDSPTEDRGIKINYAKAKRGGYRVRWYLLVSLVTAPLVLMAWLLGKSFLLVLAPGIVTTEPLQMKAPDNGVVIKIHVNPGQKVKYGDVLISMDNPLIDAQIAELERQKAKLIDHSSTERSAILEHLQQKINTANAGIKKQRKLLQNFDEYKSNGLISSVDALAMIRNTVELQISLEQAKVEYFQAKNQQEIDLEAGTIALQYKNYELELAKLNGRKNRLVIKAPFDGRVVDIEAQIGKNITKGDPLIWLSGKDKPVIVSYLDPKHMDYANIGQEATVELPNGRKIRAVIKVPTELVSFVPKRLSGPFDGEKPALKVTLTAMDSLETNIEAIPVEVNFDLLPVS